jgi:hypothetical protein
MGGRNMYPIRFNPRGVVDALDGGQVPPGGLSAAKDLIFDPSNPFTFECRPAAIKQSDFSGLLGAGAVSVSYVVGAVAYGLVASNLNPGRDEPFAYNLATNTLLVVAGAIDATTTPLSAGTAGTWIPPTMALVGVLLYVTHPGFPGGANAYFGWFDTTNPTSPVWNSGNTGVNPLPAVPTAVSQFNNRAWFTVGSAVNFTDALTTNISDATHVLNIGDSISITAMAPQPLVTSVQGIIQSLIVFKPNVVAMITGDATTGDLSVNIISSSIGSSAPRAMAATPKGVMFMAHDGIRTIGHDGTLGDPYPDLKTPFIFALTPSRASAAYNKNIFRISVQNGHANGSPIEEYWFDLAMNGWTGPHSFVQDMAYPYGDTFVAFTHTEAPGLFSSDVVQSGSSIFTENSSPMSFLLRTAPLADDGGLYEGSAVLSVIDMQLPPISQRYTFVASDVDNGVLSVAVVATNSLGALWNGFSWGSQSWTATSYGLERYNIPWTTPLVFSRVVLQATGASAQGFKIGKLTIGHQRLNYVRAL